MKRTPLAAALLSALLSGACLSPSSQSASSEPGAAMEKPQEAARKPKKEVDLENLEVDLAVARIELEGAEAKAEASVAEAEVGLADARHGLAEATRAHEHFDAFERETELAQRELSLDRSRGRFEDQVAELEQLEAMFADEEFADSTKELVINRGRRGVEQARRGLELDELQLADWTERQVPEKVEKLERAVAKAERDVAAAERRLEQARRDRDVSLLKARNRLRLAEKAMQDGLRDAGEGEAEDLDEMVEALSGLGYVGS